MKQVVIFHYSSSYTSAQEVVQDEANKWLSEHPEAQIIASHTNMISSRSFDDTFTEFTLTLIVELPDPNTVWGDDCR